MTAPVILQFPLPATPLSMNDGDTWATRLRASAWRDRSYWAWIEHHPGQGPRHRTAPNPATVSTVIPFTNRRRRDPINFARTVKHIVDGLVLAGAWPDDTPDHVEQRIPVLTITPNNPTVTVIIEPQPTRSQP